MPDKSLAPRMQIGQIILDFLFPQSLGRLSYLARSIVVSILVSLLLPLHEGLDAGFTTGHIGWLITAAGLFLYDVWFITRPRCNDAGLSLWFLLLLLVPVLDGLFLLFLLVAGSPVDRLDFRGTSNT